MHLAVFTGDQCGQGVGVLFQQVFEATQDARTAQCRGCSPGGKGGLSGSNRPLHFLCGGQRHLGADFTGRRVVDVGKALAGAGHLFAINVVLQG
ncbi:hypothetical protein D3C76_1595180 [compost metagenome]